MYQGTLTQIDIKDFKGKPYLRVEIDKAWYTIWNEPLCETVKAIGTGHRVEFETKTSDKGKVNITKIQPVTGQGGGQGAAQGSGNGSCPPPDQTPPAHNGNGRESDEVKAVRISRMNALTNAVAVLATRGFVDDKGERIPDAKVVRWVTGLADKLHHFSWTGEVKE
ncbi:MAG: hypothetical protein M0R06_04840 [Sphaerochaeta sp.]|jgi:hypothetical protein|nr:hypothetical protein [Sphaerochaeta sp.]